MLRLVRNSCFRIIHHRKCRLLNVVHSASHQKRNSSSTCTCPSDGTQNKSATAKARLVDLRTDTISRPSPEMREAMFKAEVGDDVYGEDPTVTAMEQRAAAMLGQEAGLYVCSGTMGNLIAIMAHCYERGCEVIVGDLSHTFLLEQAGASQIAGVQLCTIPNDSDGTFNLRTLKSKVRADNDFEPVTSLIIVENTHNYCGGKVVPMKWLGELTGLAKGLNIPLHMDGARLFNAAVYLKIPAANIVRDFASTTFCLSKGLGAPIGSLLVGNKQFIRRCRRIRKVLGGGMRQAGVMAAAGLIGLEKMTLRLHEDHSRLATMAAAIDKFGSKFVKVDLKNLHTNILLIHINSDKITAQDFCNRMATVTEDEIAQLGKDAVTVRINPISDTCIRMITYYEITDDDVRCVCSKLEYVFKNFGKK